jgi:CHAT domain-containing protein/Tfp pilus assembly protein PilF
LGGCHSAPPEVSYGEIQQKKQRGDLNAALQQADHLYREYAGKNVEWAWRFRVIKAEILVRRGSISDALLLVDDDVPPSLATTDIPIRRRIVRGLAAQSSQRFGDAEREFSEAEQLARSVQPAQLGDVLLSRGALEAQQQKYAEANEHLHGALSIAREQRSTLLEATALGNLGLLAMKEEHYAESIDWDQEALHKSRAIDYQTPVPTILGNMGWSYFEMGDFESALALFKQADEASSRAGLNRDRVYWLSNIGNVYYEQHDYASAEATWQQAMRLARSQDDKGAVTECLNNLSQSALDLGRIDLAEKYNKEAADLEQKGLDQFGVLYSLLIAGRIDATKRDFTAAEKSFGQVIGNPRAEASLKWEAQSRLAKVYADEGFTAKAEQEFGESIQTIEAAQESISREDLRLSFLSSAIEFYDDYIDFLVSHERSIDALAVAELSRARTLAGGLGIRSSELSLPIKEFHPAQIARRLNSVVLSYWLGRSQSYLWVITPSRVEFFTLPPASQIDSLVRSYGQTLLGPRDALEVDNLNGKRLYEILVAPAKDLIPKGSRVTVLPDAGLYELNFETLLVSTPQLHYWIEDVTIANANSLVLLAGSVRTTTKANGKLLLIGDPVSPDAQYPNLPQAAAEMARVAKYFSSAERSVFSRDHATANSYLDSLPQQFSFIHFVAHGTASRASPLDSAVILTKEGDSYKLYARDIVKQPLRADLVTISACNGAGMRTYSGEGLVGLAWAFLRAGAHRVIAALWEVNDNSTALLMDQLYSGIRKGAAPEVALREAKLSLLHSGTVYKKPFYWAPFEIYRGS